MVISISSDVFAHLVAYAGSSPDEICGLLIGRGSRVDRAVPTANVAAEPARAFEIDTAALLQAHREARRGQGDVIGHYHSHPSGRTRPSPTDAAMAHDDGCLWLIVAGDEVEGWVANGRGSVEGRFEPVALVVESRCDLSDLA